MIEIGEPCQFAWWLTGYETREQLEQYVEGIREAMEDLSFRERVVFGPARTVTLRPGDPHVPAVPDHIHGPDVRLLVTEVKVIGRRYDPAVSRFLYELDGDDLRRLRRITRKSYAREFPNRVRLTDRQCDTIINDLGPEAAAEALRAGEADVLKTLH